MRSSIRNGRAPNGFVTRRWAEAMAAIAFAVCLAAPAAATSLSSHPVVIAIRRGDCVAAVKLLNPDVELNDDQSAFLAARMLDEQICVQKDTVAATHFFARAADLGDQEAALDYAAKVGLGDGIDQSYERAGRLCRAAGLDTQGRLTAYSLGYACTVRGLADELMRQSLPKGAFRPGAPAVARVEFSPASSQMRVRATPAVAAADAATGSNLRKPLVNAEQEIEKAWRSAMAAVPKPDSAQLDDQSVELPLDLDLTLEDSRALVRNTQPLGTLVQGDVRPAGLH
jgi:hypothetical protein